MSHETHSDRPRNQGFRAFHRHWCHRQSKRFRDNPAVLTYPEIRSTDREERVITFDRPVAEGLDFLTRSLQTSETADLEIDVPQSIPTTLATLLVDTSVYDHFRHGCNQSVFASGVVLNDYRMKWLVPVPRYIQRYRSDLRFEISWFGNRFSSLYGLLSAHMALPGAFLGFGF